MSDHWRRDQPQFYNIFDLAWGKADGPPALHGVEARVVTRNPETGEGTYMVNLPAGWKHTESADEGGLEIFVLEGDMTGNGNHVGAGGYLAVPRNCGPLELSTEGGAYAYMWWTPEMPLDYYYDNQPFVTKVWKEQWTITDMPEVRHGIMHKSLRWPDPADGLIHGGPGGMIRFILLTPGFGESRQETHHDCWEEVIFLSGDFSMPERGEHAAGSLLNNPAELKHGGLMTQKGSVMILHCDAPMGAEFTPIPKGEEIVEHYHDSTSWLADPKHAKWVDSPQYDLHPKTDPTYNPAVPA
ncbi:MAG: cupin domain-containing protein [Gaiellaceae bacterium]